MIKGSSGAVARYAEAIIFDLNFLGFTFWILLSLLISKSRQYYTFDNRAEVPLIVLSLWNNVTTALHF